MNSWNDGYVTDITYLPGWYPHQSPAMMSLACLLGNVASPMPAAGDPVSVLELGCGHGYGAMVMAASNPSWKITAIDFNPAHIASAREWAAATQLTNITFLEADLSTLAGSPASQAIPEADFVTLHGVWSWVPQSVKTGIIRLLRDKVRPGGAVHVSYNVMPAWSEAIGMQRLVNTAGKRLAWRSDRQAEEGIEIVRALMQAEATHLHRSGFVRSMLQRLDSSPIAYLAHEYMNEHWAPCFMADVAGAMSDAKLDWVASADLIENFPELMLTEPQREIARKFDDPLMRELIKDMCLTRGLRHDVYVRGARRIDNATRNAALMDVMISLAIHPDDLPLQAEMPAGNAELNPQFYQPIASAASKGPVRVGDLLQLPDVEGRRDNPAELLGIMVGQNLANLVARPDAEPGADALRFNRYATQRLSRSEQLGRVLGLASCQLGGGIAATVLDLLVIDAVAQGDTGLNNLVRMLNVPAEKEQTVRESLERSLNRRLPILRKAGVF